MPLFVDRCMETTTTTGTGNITTAGAVAGYRTLNTGYGLNVFIPYCIEAVDANGVATGEWETGEGTLTGTTTFVRSVVKDSSNAGALVNFSAGTKRIFASLTAAQSARRNGYNAHIWRMT